MIGDAYVHVTCDECQSESVEIQLEYVYKDYSGNNGRYNSDDNAINETLIRDTEWKIIDGKHFCESCQENEGE